MKMATAYQWSGQVCSVGFTPPPQRRKAAATRLQTVPRGKKPAIVEFYTVKKIDNSRLLRHIEPVKLRNLYKTVALGGIVALFCMLYVYQHFRCIDLSFQLEDLKGKQELAQSANSKLKLEIATLRDPHRIDVIARHQLGLSQPSAAQVREYANVDGAEVAAVRYVQRNHAP
jgi:cell division protein FtsL